MISTHVRVHSYMRVRYEDNNILGVPSSSAFLLIASVCDWSLVDVEEATVDVGGAVWEVLPADKAPCLGLSANLLPIHGNKLNILWLYYNGAGKQITKTRQCIR